MGKKQRRDIYQEITDRILELLDRGTVPWRNPIRRQGGGGWPRNLKTQKRYRGINVFLLAVTAWERGFDSDYWLTFRQAKQLGGSVKKGEKSSLVTFWKLYDTKDRESGNEVTLPVLRHYHVFNAQQCEDIAAPDQYLPDPHQRPFQPTEAAEAIVSGYDNCPVIEEGGNRACYQYQPDKIWIPVPQQFETPESRYATLFHELVHSTGHRSRLDRGLEANPAPFGSPDYSHEELVAETGSAMLSALAGISPPTIEQSAAYIDHWRKALRGDKRLVVQAAGAGQKAADWILGETFQNAAGNREGKDPSATSKPLPPPPPTS